MIDGSGVSTGWIWYETMSGMTPMDIERMTNQNISGMAYGDDGSGPQSTEVLSLASGMHSVVLYSKNENIRLTAGKNIYLDAPDGDILFKANDYGSSWYKIGTAFFQ